MKTCSYICKIKSKIGDNYPNFPSNSSDCRIYLFQVCGQSLFRLLRKIFKPIFNKFFSNSKDKKHKPTTNPQVRLLNPAKMIMR